MPVYTLNWQLEPPSDHTVKNLIVSWGPIVCTSAHCSKGGAKVKINVFKFWLDMHSPVPNEGLHWKRSKIDVCIALNLLIEKIHFWVLLVKFDSSSEINYSGAHIKKPLITPTQKTFQCFQFIGNLADFDLNGPEHFAPPYLLPWSSVHCKCLVELVI